MQLPAIELPEPLLAYAIAPKTKGDEDKLATGLARLREEDPTLRVARNEETHETVMHGMGEAHLEVHDRAAEAQVRRGGDHRTRRRSPTARRSEEGEGRRAAT